MHASHKILNLNYKEYFGIRIFNFVIPNIYIYKEVKVIQFLIIKDFYIFFLDKCLKFEGLNY